VSFSAAAFLACTLAAAQEAAPTALERAKAAAAKAVEEQTAAEKRAAESAAAANTLSSQAAAAQDAAQKAAAEKQAADNAAKLAAEAAAAAAKVVEEKDLAAKTAAQTAAAAKTAADTAAAEKAASDKALAEKAAAAKAAADQVVSEEAYAAKIAAEQAAKEKSDAEQAAAQAANAAKSAADQLAAAQAAAATAAAEKATAEQALAAVAEAEKPALQKTLDEKNAAAAAATEKAAAAKTAADNAAAQSEAAQKAVPEKAAAVVAAQDKAAAARATALGGLPPLASSAWDYAKARHLLVRAGFGGTPEEVKKLHDLGLHNAVDYLVDIYERPLANIELDPLRLEHAEPWEGRLEEPERTELANRRINRERVQQAELRRWWLMRMAQSPRPLQEKLTLFWHDHFAVQYEKLYLTHILYQQNELFRTYGCDNYAGLLRGIVHDPAMILYLDNHANFKDAGNENLGREILELFSLGEGQGYTEDDMRAAARCLTGYNYDWTTGQFRFVATRHDETEKNLFGNKGNWGGDELVDLILGHPSTAKYIAHKLFVLFAYEDPEPETIERLAHVLRSGNYDLRPMLKNLFLSEQFYSDRARGTHIKGPVELVIGTIRDLGIKNADYGAVDAAVIQMGQYLYEPPNVAGWKENRAWIDAERILIRYNHIANLVEQSNVDVVGLLEGKGLQTAQQVVDYLATTCLMASPGDEQRNELVAFLGELPPAAEWAAQRDPLNAKLRALLVLLLSTPQAQLG
jgi:hypothetical protein